MKAFLLIGTIFSVLLLILGFTSRNTAGRVLSNAVIIGGVIIAVFVAVIWIMSLVQKKSEKVKK